MLGDEAITLLAVDTPKTEKLIKKYTAEMAKLGCQPVGAYQIEEFGDSLEVAGYCNWDEGVVGVLYIDEEQGLIHVDFFIEYESGNVLDVTSQKLMAMVKLPAGDEHIEVSDIGDLNNLFQVCLSNKRNEVSRLVDHSNFVSYLQGCYDRVAKENGNPTSSEQSGPAQPVITEEQKPFIRIMDKIVTQLEQRGFVRVEGATLPRFYNPASIVYGFRNEANDLSILLCLYEAAPKCMLELSSIHSKVSGKKQAKEANTSRRGIHFEDFDNLDAVLARFLKERGKGPFDQFPEELAIQFDEFSDLKEEKLFRVTYEIYKQENKRKKNETLVDYIERNAKKLIVPSIVPVTVKGKAELDGSHFGGVAFIKASDNYPCCENCGEVLTLLLQVNCADLPAEGKFPIKTGLLQVFHCLGDCDAEYGDRIQPEKKIGLVRVVKPAKKHQDVDETVIEYALKEKKISKWKPNEEHPDFDSEVSIPFADDEIEEYKTRKKGKARYPAEGDKLGGWPTWVQDPEVPVCAECHKPMRFILQIESNKNIDYSFGDVGTLYVYQCKVHKSQFVSFWQCT